MKKTKILSVISSIFLVSILGGCNPPNTDKPDVPDNPVIESKNGLININYLRDDNSYSSWALWIWADGKDGMEVTSDVVGDYGAIFTLNLDDPYFEDTLKYDSPIGVIVKSKGSWDKKDVSSDRFFTLSSMEKKDNVYSLYLVTGDETMYYDSSLVTLERISTAILTYSLRFKIITSKPFSKYELLENEKVIASEDNLDKKMVEIDVPSGVELSVKNKYSCKVTFKESSKVSSKDFNTSILYNRDEFINNYTYDGELGAIYSESYTTFNVWSPVATKINLKIYDTGTPLKVNKEIGNDTPIIEQEMELNDKGLYSLRVDGDLEGKYYTYEVFNNFNAINGVEVVDPYAKSTGINGLRGMIVDFAKTNPVGWEDVNYLQIDKKEMVVYETHIQDLTSSSTWSNDPEVLKYKLTFNGAALSGTRYKEEGKDTLTTGFDHIKELGVNAVQLLPIFDQDNDETSKTFNWGYNPLNYNSLEGSYSLDPYDGYEKIKEFKNLVKTYNEAGIAIIMDVVYNHMSSIQKSGFNYLVPNYYFRYSNGSPTNGSGCGNETDSERPMMKKFMIDSTEFWAKEYKLSGFRFDLMGLHDLDTMEKISSNLNKINPYSVVYGEPWTGGDSPLASSLSAKQDNIGSYEGYGAFNDKFRDALIRGGLSAKNEKGWVNSSSALASDVEKIKAGLAGKLFLNAAKIINDPNKNVQYVTCHDNYTLKDRMEASEIEDANLEKKMAMLANSLVLSSKGTTFMLSGEEFLRSKGGNSNSYNASYKVNELDYSLKYENMDMFNNYKSLINFKKTNKTLHTTNEEDSNFEFETSSINKGSTIIEHSKDVLNKKEYLVAYNNGYEGDETIDFSGYTLYLDTLNDNSLVLNDAVKLKPYETIIAIKSL